MSRVESKIPVQVGTHIGDYLVVSNSKHDTFHVTAQCRGIANKQVSSVPIWEREGIYVRTRMRVNDTNPTNAGIDGGVKVRACELCRPLEYTPIDRWEPDADDLVPCLGRDDEWVVLESKRMAPRLDTIRPPQVECMRCSQQEACYAYSQEIEPDQGIWGGVRKVQRDTWGDDAPNIVRRMLLEGAEVSTYGKQGVVSEHYQPSLAGISRS